MTKIRHFKSVSSHRRPIAVDLFAGAGGFSLSVEQAGFDVVVAVENDPVHAAVYAYNFPQTEVICEDISTLSSRTIYNAVAQGGTFTPELGRQHRHQITEGEIDLVIGGPPSQGFAIMGKGVVEDERNDLVFDFARIVCELQPRYFVMENVPSLVSEQYAEFLNRLLNQFEQAGYWVTQPVQVLNASEFGVPQDRQRLFLLGSRLGQVLLSYPKSATITQPTVRDAISDLPNVDDFPELLNTDELPLSSQVLQNVEQGATHYVRSLREQNHDLNNFAYQRIWNQHLLTGCLRTAHTPHCVQRFQDTPMGKVESSSRLRRLHLDGVSHALRAGTGKEGGRHTSPRPIHPVNPRVITVREAARLHSFPDWFRFHCTKWHGFRQVGNALPPLLGRAVAQEVIHALGVIPEIPDELIELGDPELLRMSPSQAAQYWKSMMSE